MLRIVHCLGKVFWWKLTTSTQGWETKKFVTNSKLGFVTRKVTWSFVTLVFHLIVYLESPVVSNILYCLTLTVHKKVPHQLVGGSMTIWSISYWSCLSILERVLDHWWVLVENVKSYCPNLKYVCMLWSHFLIQHLHLSGTYMAMQRQHRRMPQWKWTASSICRH